MPGAAWGSEAMTAGSTRAAGSEAAALAVAGALAGSGLTTYRDLKAGLKEAMAKDPFDATVITVVAGAFLFYVAERGKNPKVQTYWDALVFISTCLSVGYSDIFARTPAGQAIATAVMTFGPAMSGAMFESPSAAPPEPSPEMLAVQHAIVDKLDAILSELRASRS
jgi:hypothetical protein